MAFPLPIPAALTSAFGWRIHPIFGDRRFHAGIDLGAPQGTPVIAAVSGQVVVANNMGGYGLTVVLENQSVTLRNLYAHLSGIAVQPGTWVEQGSVIGWVGSTGNSTGPHLHFEAQQLTANGWVAVDPLANGAMSVARAQ
ncbi:MAG: M23 family metallopeptidase [Leptolyngbyaceae cyanobacterium SL_5_9]|nr:M23 family metallopeptidase [Leptolyngbyaceae cyanobacterium SL_5_9]NJO75044.1 M23 family metallopeptidase [Leptolyngbyaceae cyanobacterium RM1_406_9]